MAAREFADLLELSTHLALRTGELALHLHHGLERAALAIEKTAKAEIGHYQPAAGPFPAWAPLSPYTLDGFMGFPGKIELGYAPPDNPLLREGTFREAITHDVEGLEAVIGVKGGQLHSEGVDVGDLATWFEFGTSRMPMRPVLGPAAFHNLELLRKLCGAAVLSGLIGIEKVHEALGYDMATVDNGIL